MKTIEELFKENPRRGQMLTKELFSKEQGISIDYSKTHLTEEDMRAWEEKLSNLDIIQRIEFMFAGEKINYTENRQVLHVKLRSKNVIDALSSGNVDVLDKEEKAIHKELLQMQRICTLFGENKLLGASGKPIKNVVGIGIGGSDLGPRLLTSALSTAPADKRFRYVSNVDAQEMDAATRDLALEETVFVVVSKTFTTQETLENAKLALSKMTQAYSSSEANHKQIVKAHFLAVTAAKAKAVEFGVAAENVLDMWDYVGGRYSLWSCVSLTSAMAMGFPAFVELLSGAACMDSHFLNASTRNNLPMFHAMVECKYINEYGFNNKCVVPYDYYMKLLPAYLQQCEMESNGKSCTKNGALLLTDDFVAGGVPAASQTASIIWGGLGTDVQHSYFQQLHQGTARILTEFLIPARPKVQAARASTEATGASSKAAATSTAHDVLVANCLAQSRALMLGKRDAPKDKFFSGNRPSITVMYSSLTPFTLGMLIALYEHKIFVQGQVWEINSYDQFGVELGKKLAKELLALIESSSSSLSLDSSTSSLLEWYRARR